MKTIIFSDTHLTDVFDKQKYAYLVKRIASVDQVIINGDFWDGFETSFEKFAASQWKKLFPLLRAKQALYIFGNHDTKKWTSDPSLFSVYQSDRIILRVGKKELWIEHGQKIAPSFDITYPKLSTFLSMFFSSAHLPFRSSLRGFDNVLMKRYVKKNLAENQILVCGHSHIPEFNKAARFINTGFIENGIASYLLVSSNNLALRMETYQEVI